MRKPLTHPHIKTSCYFCSKEIIRTVILKHSFCSYNCYWTWMRTLRPSWEIPRRYSERDLIDNLQQITNNLGRLPSITEFKKQSIISTQPYRGYFGSWRLALACIKNPLPPAPWRIDNITEQEGGWLAGLADGESMFRLPFPRTSCTPVWGIQLRADDLQVLEEVKRILGLSTALKFWHRDHDRKRGINAGDAVRLYVTGARFNHERIVPTFRRFSLRSKKRFEFELFAEGVQLLYQHQQNLKTRHYSSELRDRLTKLSLEIKELKKYHRPNEIDVKTP